MYRYFSGRSHRAGASLVAAAAILCCASASAHESGQRDDLIVQWNAQFLQAVRDTHPAPTVAARALAVAHTCIYDAWAAYDDRAAGTMYGDRLRRPSRERTERNKRAAISHAAFAAAVDLFPSQRANFEAFMRSVGYDPGDRSSVPGWIGHTTCAAVLAYRHEDGSNQLGNLHPGAYSDYTGYQPVNTVDSLNDPGRWQPLRVPTASGGFVIQTFATPQWGRVRPFAIDVRRMQVPPPAPYGSKAFLEQVREVISYSASLSEVQKCVAEYWADGPKSETPPGHWNLFAQFVSERDRHGLDQDAKMFFALNNAVMDAGIEVWWVKREVDYVRPITAVHDLFAGKIIEAWEPSSGALASIRGEDWVPFQSATTVTPPFAEYISGHSTFSAAGARILQLFTGSNVFGYTAHIEPGTSLVQPGVVPAARVDLSWGTFEDAANEAGLSRRYGGIHFRDADLAGRQAGRQIANQVWDKATRLFESRGHHGRH
jgi:hypothetical protein